MRINAGMLHLIWDFQLVHDTGMLMALKKFTNSQIPSSCADSVLGNDVQTL